jgi:putative SOS response-associated peptidase YedK
MCGRYYSLFDKQQIAEHFHVRRTADNVGIIAPNWNVAPGDPQPVIRRNHDTGERELVTCREFQWRLEHERDLCCPR